ncbi:hypothetical protein TW85_13100 [Marinomonas sp. S3726]|uniref:hypothetical protein n=1 Tax=Marinomonas sp. S3726 TaxID=579484 RepID=UPI0005FA50D3|nr:hypothetical protein [Marinomonas sp. S3726]KJZ13627.1 hypothetical protein TW85_13100 [Marinomonas sp. S3726]
MPRQSELDKQLTRFMIDVFKVLLDRDVKGVSNKIAIISSLAMENPAGAKGAALFLGVLAFMVPIMLYAAFGE